MTTTETDSPEPATESRRSTADIHYQRGKRDGLLVGANQVTQAVGDIIEGDTLLDVLCALQSVALRLFAEATKP